MTGSYTPGALITPVTVLTKLHANAAGTTPGFTGQIKTKIFTGTVTTALVNPKGATGGTYKIKIRVGCDFDLATVFRDQPVDRSPVPAEPRQFGPRGPTCSLRQSRRAAYLDSDSDSDRARSRRRRGAEPGRRGSGE
jgi:hypothetical protein